MKLVYHFFVLYGLTTSTLAIAEPLRFKDLWRKISDQSPELASQRLTQEATDLALTRAKLHWIPQIGIQATAYTSNDPGSNFFATLSQRQVEVADFNPSSLNTPGYHVYQSLNLGINLPLYEGGQKAQEVKALRFNHEAHELQLIHKKRTLFTEILNHYAGLVTDLGTLKKLQELKAQVQSVLSKYSIGNQANPVGYSGVLGLKGLKNRIEAEESSLSASRTSHQVVLTQKSSLPQEALIPSELNLQELAHSVLTEPKNSSSLTLMEELAFKKVQALQAQKTAEQSRYLPRIGLFGQQSLTHGDRSTGISTSAGITLAWSLFSPEHYNQASEKNALAQAASRDQESAKQAGLISQQSLKTAEEAITQTLKLLSESDQLLLEQVKVASRLFQSGSLSALQLSEVYNRRADLILSIRQAEQKWIELKGQKILTLSSSDDSL